MEQEPPAQSGTVEDESSWPVVTENAFKPSGNRGGYLFSTLFGLLIAPLSGGLLLLLEEAVAAIARELGLSCCAVLLAVVFTFALGFASGGLTGVVVGRGAVLDKNRDPKLVRTIAGIAGGLAILTFIPIRILAYNVEAFDNVIDFAKTIIFAVPTIYVAMKVAEKPINSVPFCEDCDTWMKRWRLGKVIAADADVIMPRIERRAFESLASSDQIPSGSGTPYIDTLVWYCPICRSNGYLAISRTIYNKQTDRKGKVSYLPATVQIVSERLSAEEIKRALSIPESKLV